MLTLKKNAKICIVTESGNEIEITYGKRQSLLDVICNLIKHTTVADDIDSKAEIMAELTKAN